MRGLGYGIVYGLFYMVSLLPYRALYAVSDFLYLILYHIVRYRRALVRGNITSSFPEKSVVECVTIEKGFYRWFCDYFVETVKLMSVSSDELLRHIEFRNAGEIEKCFDEGQSCAALLGHYCNWELLSATGLSFKRHKEAVCGLIYHPMHSSLFDKLFIKIRQSQGGLCIPKNDVPRYLISFRSQKLMNLFGYIADQLPKYSNIHLWLPFLEHDTPVFTGGERLMRKMNNAVFYVGMERPERGKYICTFRLMTRTPNELGEFELTRRFFVMLEETIRRDPRFYLWSHNRWRRTHEEFDRMFKVENGHVVKRQGVDRFVKELPGLFDSEGETIHSGRNTVKLFDVGGRSVVVKRYKKPNIIQCVSYSFFRKSKAERACLYAAELQRRGFNTPMGIAFVEIKKCFFLRESYFVSDYCGLPSVMPLLKREDFDCGLAEALAKFLVSLHEKGVLHGDLNLSNILFEKGSGGYRFWLIDTNRSRFKKVVDNGEGMAEDVGAHNNVDERARIKLAAEVDRAELKFSGDVEGAFNNADDNGGSELKQENVTDGATAEGMKYEQPTKKECIENLKRLTHERGLMEFVVRRYAAIRGWDVDETVAAVMRCLQRFERKEQVKRVFK